MTRFRILIVEDDDEWQRILNDKVKTAVEETGHDAEITVVADFKSGWDQLGRAGRWTLLISDIGLPGNHSESRMGKLLVERARDKLIPCIVVSGTGELTPADTAQLLEELGARYFFWKKSWESKKFIARTRELLQEEIYRENRVFISYSHRDADWLDKLRAHLQPLEKVIQLEIWDDTRIQPGTKWREEIMRAMTSSKAALFLVSKNFAASAFIQGHELPTLLDSAEKNRIRVIPIITAPTPLDQNPELKQLMQYQAVNAAQPLTTLSDDEMEAVFDRVCQTVKDALEP